MPFIFWQQLQSLPLGLNAEIPVVPGLSSLHRLKADFPSSSKLEIPRYSD